MGKYIDLINRKFNSLLVLKPNEIGKDGHYIWLCRCKCGKELNVLGSSLKNDNTKSCGCLRVVGIKFPVTE